MIAIGDRAPDFALPGIKDGEKRIYTLSEYRGRKLVLAFYPGDFTPGCTRQMCSYRDNFSDFESTGAVLLGISPQDIDSHERWAETKQFHFPLLADVDKQAIEAYGVGGPFGFVRRSVFVVDGEGVVKFADRKLIGATFVPIGKLVPILDAIRS